MLDITEYKVLGKLPDPFLFDDGTPVKTKEDWKKRRKELYKTVIELQYGTMPPKPEVFKVETLYLGGKGKSNTYLITAGTKEKTVSFRMRLHLPTKEQFDYNTDKKPPRHRRRRPLLLLCNGQGVFEYRSKRRNTMGIF